jgi:23S rRNA pseudouridine1911/1915/1917 synthase
VSPDEPCEEAREAVTQVRLLEAARPCEGSERSVIRVELMPLTGRMHQLRIQAASRGMPVLGDSIYGSTTTFLEASDGSIVPPIALHASRIEYLDPDTKSPVVVESPPPW